MQKSRSILSFGPRAEHVEVRRETRSQRRSSLDTFLIPGRTRLPSSKSSVPSPDATDIQIAHNLLTHDIMPRPRVSPIKPVLPRSGNRGRGSHPDRTTTRSRSERHTITPQSQASRRRMSQRIQSPPQSSQELVISPPRRRTEHGRSQESPHLIASDTSADLIHDQSDGPNEGPDHGHSSRMTSTTWSAVSQRMISDSSASSHAFRHLKYKSEYNRQAEKEGLTLLPGENEDTEEDSDASQTKVARKSHHGWFSRKILRRSSSTYTFRAKTTYKALNRKKSLSSIRSSSSGPPTNVLIGRSLDEVCRLGGTGLFTLPKDFAVDKLRLPTSLSACANHLLEHGCNAPGIFRINGTVTTVKAFFKYFDLQFSDAGSPSKVEETVGIGLLPNVPEFGLNDIASLFKKIIFGIPGGLLGSLEIFNALRSILLDWHPDPRLSAQHVARSQAKLIALIILSIDSKNRVHLIQAVLGLVAYFGFEADKAQKAAKFAAENNEQHNQPGSEVMGNKAFGAVFGSLVLGNLSDSIDLNGGSNELQSGARQSADHHQEAGKKAKKQQHDSVPNKLESGPTSSRLGDQYKVAAKIMELLLVCWRDVVQQLNEIEQQSIHQQQQSDRHPKPLRSNPVEKVRRRTASGPTMSTTEEEVGFMDAVRGRTPPQDFHRPVRMKSNVTMTSRSPLARGAIQVYDDSDVSHDWLPDSGKDLASRSQTPSTTNEPGELGMAPKSESAGNVEWSESAFDCSKDVSSFDYKGWTRSDHATDEMAKGTMLTPLNHPMARSKQTPLSRSNTPFQTPEIRSRKDSPCYVPETAIRTVPISAHRPGSVRVVTIPPTNKPLPPVIRDDQMADYVPRPGDVVDVNQETHERILSNRRSGLSRASADHSPIATHHSTPQNDFRSRESGKMTSSPTPQQEKEYAHPYRQSSFARDQNIASRPTNSIPTFNSVEAYKAAHNTDSTSPPERSAYRLTNEIPPMPNRVLDQGKRGDGSGNVKCLTRKFAESLRTNSNSELKRKPIVIPENTKIPFDDPFISPGRETLIPKPIRDIGHGRKSESVVSPKRSSSPPKRTAPPAPKYVQKRPSSYNVALEKTAIVRPNAMPETRNDGEAHRAMSRDMRSTHALQGSSDQTHPGESTPAQKFQMLERHGSISEHLQKEVQRLSRNFEQRDQQYKKARRTFDTMMEARVASPTRSALKKQMSTWKRRAMKAETDFADLQTLIIAATEGGVINVDALMLEVVEKANDKPRQAPELYEDGGWEFGDSDRSDESEDI